MTAVKTKAKKKRTPSNGRSSFDYMSLSVPQRIELVQEIWDSIADEELPPMSEEEKRVIDERLDAYHASPYKGDSWDDLKKEILRKHDA